ncbi:polysulfide reductase NrfD [Skermanella rosea]|uniref:NrfD/PsrC family molybdoenzyme membrane anchor subunit n=1 Tax=Skermanella rosea TaxID=1817965 RepID=UPI0019349E14|nr:NrfD/PsrC family molybdoenzyme membrane anchor subunit [Skermanella rosea]UEM03301.1 polysulfide reductase NrfD [Skermanella rosea]
MTDAAVRQAAVPRPATEDWNGETYYGQASLKPSPFDWKIATYVYIAGIAGSSQIVATLADRLGDGRDETIVRNGRYLALAGALAGPPLLIADLKTPERFYNMLRIYRTSSPMSFGSYILTGFGLASGLTALGHLAGERRRDGSRSGARRAADMVQVPAAFLGAGMSTYTAALLSATSTPLWAAAPRAMAVQFGTSAMATAAAALSLCEQVAGDPENCRRLDGLAAIAVAGELVASALAERRHHEAGVGQPLRKGPIGIGYKAGALALGLGVPLACHAVNALSKRPSRGLSVLGSLAILAGGMIMRQAIFQAGNRSAERPDEYFRLTRREPEGTSPRRRVDRDLAARGARRLP